MRLKAGCEITLDTPEPCPIVGMLRPRSGVAQWLCSESYRFEPHVHTTEYVDSYGNLCQRFVAPQGRMRLRVDAVVETEDTLAVDLHAPATPVAEMPSEALQFLLQSRYCPSDKMSARAQHSSCLDETDVPVDPVKGIARKDGVEAGDAGIPGLERCRHRRTGYGWSASAGASGGA